MTVLYVHLILCPQNPTRRNTMEDVYRVVPVFDGDKDTSFVAVYDGHGGEWGLFVGVSAIELAQQQQQEAALNV